jgi:hypothetical protein
MRTHGFALSDTTSGRPVCRAAPPSEKRYDRSERERSMRLSYSTSAFVGSCIPSEVNFILAKGAVNAAGVTGGGFAMIQTPAELRAAEQAP